jgi:uncharacterized protein (DUF1810 family)
MNADTAPGVRCFFRHIGAAGFRVKRALCQEAVLLGWVVFWRTHGSLPSPLSSPYGVAAMGQDYNYQLDTMTLGRKGDFCKCLVERIEVRGGPYFSPLLL